MNKTYHFTLKCSPWAYAVSSYYSIKKKKKASFFRRPSIKVNNWYHLSSRQSFIVSIERSSCKQFKVGRKSSWRKVNLCLFLQIRISFHFRFKACTKWLLGKLKDYIISHLKSASFFFLICWIRQYLAHIIYLCNIGYADASSKRSTSFHLWLLSHDNPATKTVKMNRSCEPTSCNKTS